MPIITKYIDYECAGLIKKRGLRSPEKIAKKFHIPLDEIELIEKENDKGQLSTFIRIPILNVMKYFKSAKQKFTYKCDECGKEVTTYIYKYFRKDRPNTRIIPTSLDDKTLCGKCLSEETNLKIYGCKNVFANEEIKQRIKKTNLERYNHEYATQSEKIKEKTRQTNLRLYNVECTLQREDEKQKKLYKRSIM